MADEPDNPGSVPTDPPPADTPPAPTPEPPSRPAPEASRDDSSITGLFQRLEDAVTGLPEAVANAVREQTPTPPAPPTPAADTSPTNSVSKVKGPGRIAKWWYGK